MKLYTDRIGASRRWLWAAALVGLCSCGGSANEPGSLSPGSDDGGKGGSGGPTSGFDPSSGSGGSAANGGAGGSSGGVPVIPEKEAMVDLEVPRAGARYVYAANTKRDTVAVIDSSNLSIRTVEVGDKPSFLATVPGQDIALVINAGSADVSIVRTTAAGSVVSTVPVASGPNRISVAPNGAYAIAWYDSRVDGGIGGANGSFQDVSLIRLVPGADTSVPLTVGFRPNAVAFSSDGLSAFVVTEDGVSIIRPALLTVATVVPLVALGPVSAQGATDVSITPDGKYALARKEGSGVVSLVDLATGVAASADLGSPVTDLDLSPDGTMVVAVMREVSKMVTLPLPLGFTSEAARVVQTFGDEKVGSAVLAPNGLFALLYTTVGNVERAVVASIDGVVPPRAVQLRKSMRAVAISPDSASAMVMHAKVDGDPAAKDIGSDLKIDRSYGYSIVKLATGFAKLQLTQVEPGPLTFVPDSSLAFLLLRSEMQELRLTQQVNLLSFAVTDYVMSSPPLSLAVMSGTNKLFVSQAHPSGRLSFVDWTTGTVESVTGFELNGGIRE